MSKDDVRRYIKFEAPSLAMVENDVSKVVCFRNGCSEQVTVDPSTLVPEDDEAVDLVAQVADMGDPLQEDAHDRVEIYCSSDCRNQRYTQPDTDREAQR